MIVFAKARSFRLRSMVALAITGVAYAQFVERVSPPRAAQPKASIREYGRFWAVLRRSAAALKRGNAAGFARFVAAGRFWRFGG
jgi:hypothetical protein